MSILSTYQTNKAIAAILASQSTSSTESKQAFQKIKKIGPTAIPKLISALPTSKENNIIEMLLQGFVSKETLNYYIEALGSSNQRIIQSITRVLSNVDNFDANVLVELLDQPQISKQALSDIILSHAKTINTRPIISQLDKVSSTTRPILYRILEKIVTRDSLPYLITKTRSNEPMVRAYLAALLARFNTPEVHNTLIDMLADPNKNVRQAVLKSLATLDAKNAVESICQSLHDPDLIVQSAAIEALIQINADNTVKYLIDVLQDDSEYVRRAAVEVLNVIGDQRAIKDLLNALRDADWWVKVRAADALGTIGGPKVSEAVLQLIKDEDEFMRRTAVEILNTSKDPRAFDRLVEALKDEDWWVRERAADALAAIGDNRAVQPLLDMLENTPKASQVAIRALAALGDQRAIQPLLTQLRSSQDTATRREAMLALKQLTDKEHVAEVQEAISQLIDAPNLDLNAEAIEAMKTLVTRYGKPHNPTSNQYEVEGSDDVSLHSLIDIDLGNNKYAVPNTNSQKSQSPVKNPAFKTMANDVNIHILDATLLKPGDTFLDRYLIIKQVGKGAFGVVVLVEDLIVSDQFILKFLNPQVAMDDNVIQRFTHELRYARRITHENVIRIYDFITHKKTYAISMEYFASHSLAFELKNKNPINISRGIKLLQKICSGMTAAQSANVVHRDLKPGNILINDTDELKIVDFGLAAAASTVDSRLTKTGILVGTPTYMAPEQVRGKSIDARTDIYSLGVIMYEMFTGRAPYISDEALGIMFQHVEGNATPPSELNPLIDDSLQSIIIKAMQINPDDRYQSFEEFGNALELLAWEIN